MLELVHPGWWQEMVFAQPRCQPTIGIAQMTGWAAARSASTIMAAEARPHGRQIVSRGELSDGHSRVAPLTALLGVFGVAEAEVGRWNEGALYRVLGVRVTDRASLLDLCWSPAVGARRLAVTADTDLFVRKKIVSRRTARASERVTVLAAQPTPFEMTCMVELDA